MPELPEMQALAERVNEELAGMHLAGVLEYSASARRSVDPQPESIVGYQVMAVTRRGKFLVISLKGSGSHRLVVHLSQAGRLDIESPPKATKPKTARVRFLWSRSHDGGSDVATKAVFLREFGRDHKLSWSILESGDEGPLANLGPDAGTADAASRIRANADRTRVHSWLRDQRNIAGMGRGHTDDAMWRACLTPTMTMERLNDEQRDALIAAIEGTLEDAVRREQTRSGGLSDASLGKRFLVHGQAGNPCLRCAEPLHRISYSSYEIVYCPTCQTGGRVLADRRRSRLLR